MPRKSTTLPPRSVRWTRTTTDNSPWTNFVLLVVRVGRAALVVLQAVRAPPALFLADRIARRLNSNEATRARTKIPDREFVRGTRSQETARFRTSAAEHWQRNGGMKFCQTIDNPLY